MRPEGREYVTRVTNQKGAFVDGYTDPELSPAPVFEVTAFHRTHDHDEFRGFSAWYDRLEQAAGAFALLASRYSTVWLNNRATKQSLQSNHVDTAMVAVLLKTQPICTPAIALRLSDATTERRERRKRMREQAATIPRKRRQITERGARDITAAVRSHILERDGFRCRRCGNGPEHSRLVVDHIVPVAHGGTADEENLQTLCELCNLGKKDHAPHEHDLRIA